MNFVFINIIFKLIFRVATYSKNTQLFKNLVHDNSIYITWVEDVHSFSLGEFPFDYTANILIFPRPNSLYRIRIFLNVLSFFILTW